ncbi:TPA: hypothetical protein IAC10_13790 [Candidatus Scatousia excrementigallinarum]|uniref:Uncharacterized protein n=1 Tax=Candidatus Scatousia excrementigallinarum TaxID=2840935 RepID=A0A9D1F252_9BACT|nr:hypothetical protein [Candidatus Scatousia excrementigallinarum]
MKSMITLNNSQINTSNRNNVSFQALKLQPKQWPENVLNSVLESKTIQNIIRNDAKNGKDTTMVLNYDQKPFRSYVIAELNINNSLKLSGSASTYGADVSEALANTIRKLDYKGNLAENLEKIKKIAGAIIYE